jgi:hypothetical protein
MIRQTILSTKKGEFEPLLMQQIYFNHCANFRSAARIFLKFAPLLEEIENERR